MSTCRGCWTDDRVPGWAPGMVLMGVSYRDGDEDPYVSHRDDEPDCPVQGGQPHRMTECGMFAPPRQMPA